ncbi:MAG: UDP-glucose 4-epimerase GalE [Brevinematales bacterium]|nr:UDP-glucose 4-epimerase GalE [Brevinematales bacterium]
MAILVAGGAGYIGSHTVKLLYKKGYDVIVYDNLSKGYREFVKWGKFVQGDIADSIKLKEVFNSYKIDAVMHFCAFIEVGESVVEPEKYYKNNLVNTINLLNTMKEMNVKKFIFSSTAAIFGEPEHIPIKEDDRKNPINPYGKSKLFVEQILEDYEKAYNFNSICFRYFNAAGADPEGEIGEAHNPESHLIPLVFDAAIGKREYVKIYGTDYPTKDGTCIRDYIHVNDLAEAHILGLEYLLNQNKSEKFNLGSGEGYSVKEIIDTVKKVTGKDFKVIETERRAGDPPVLIANSSKAKGILGWERKFSLNEIISSAWEWHKKKDSVNLN